MPDAERQSTTVSSEEKAAELVLGGYEIMRYYNNNTLHAIEPRDPLIGSYHAKCGLYGRFSGIRELTSYYHYCKKCFK